MGEERREEKKTPTNETEREDYVNLSSLRSSKL